MRVRVDLLVILELGRECPLDRFVDLEHVVIPGDREQPVRGAAEDPLGRERAAALTGDPLSVVAPISDQEM